MTDDMLSWLRGQIETRKALAEEAHAASWAFRERLVERSDGGSDDLAEVLDAEDGTVLFGVNLPGPGADEDDLKHIAFNDPRQIIADCAADLAEIARHVENFAHECEWCADHEGDFPCSYLRRQAYRYQHRPGYFPEWAPEGTTP